MKNKGFTLIELMVTITIMLIMAAVVFFNYNKFNESSLLNALAYDMSLTIRQAQVYGMAVRESGSAQSTAITTSSFNNFDSPYGVHFDKNNPKQFIMFVDIDGDGEYKLEDDGPPLQTYTFLRNITIKDLCFTPLHGSSDNCSIGSGKSVAKTLDITFKRPDPEAIIKADDPSAPVDAATIYLQNADGSITKSVVVYSTGQISVQ